MMELWSPSGLASPFRAFAAAMMAWRSFDVRLVSNAAEVGRRVQQSWL
jgi:hypothetical protein